MTEDLPNSFPSEMRAETLALIQNARSKGWQIGIVRITGDQSAMTISISGRSKDGGGFFFSCERANFIERLTTLFSK